MSISTRRGRRTVVMAFAGALVLGAAAQSVGWANPSTESAASAPDQVSDAVAEEIIQAQDALVAEDPVQALDILRGIEPVTAFDAAILAQVRGQAFFMQDDLPAARAAYEAAIATGGLSLDRVQRVEYTLLQLAVSLGEREGIEQALDAARNPLPAASVFNSTLFAHAYFQLDDIETALEHARTARSLKGQYDEPLERMIRYFELLIEAQSEQAP